MSAADSLTLIAGDSDRCGIELGMVTAHGSLYVRAFRGTRSTADPALADQVDAAYQAKYHENSRLVTHATARGATVEILPR